MSAAMVTGLFVGTGFGNTYTAKAQEYGISNPRVENGVTTWDKIKFGQYYQDAHFEEEPIKWRILSIDKDNNALLLADKNLDARAYNDKGTEKTGEDGNTYTDYSCTWETCTLRKWLNDDFYNEVFDEEEQASIIETEVVNDDNSEYGTVGGNNTRDNVFLLSIAEASNPEYGFDSNFNSESDTRIAKSTDYAKINGVWTSDVDDYIGNSEWWLRSPGHGSDCAAYVSNIGTGIRWGMYGEAVEQKDFAVRPVLRINLLSSKVTYAGEVNSIGNESEHNNGYNNPVVCDGVTTWDCVYFGKYRQKAELKKQDIEWRVLSVDEDDAFIIADKTLDCKPYNEKSETVTWETCTLRTWLNKEFYSEVFSTEEQAAIRETEVVNDNNSYYETEGGNNTIDKIYILSTTEVSNPKYGFDNDFNSNSDTRIVNSTDYVKLNIAGSCTMNALCWLRSPGENSKSASIVNYYGRGFNDGCNVDYSRSVVRPALHINLSSSVWSKAGVVSTVNNISEEDIHPTQTPHSGETKRLEIDLKDANSVSMELPDQFSITDEDGNILYFDEDGSTVLSKRYRDTDDNGNDIYTYRDTDGNTISEPIGKKLPNDGIMNTGSLHDVETDLYIVRLPTV